MADRAAQVDVDAYFRRVGYAGRRDATLDVLGAITERHALSLTFENVDVVLGRRIRLDPRSLEDKLLSGGRGGYCHEHNMLLAGIFTALGYDVTLLGARVRWMVPAGRVAPRSHLLLSVGIPSGPGAGERRLVDGGFGGIGITAPLRMDFEGEQPTLFEPQRIVHAGPGHLLQARMSGEWRDVYVFYDEPLERIDVEVANWFASTHPESRFTNNLVVSRATPQARYMLFNRDLAAYRIDRVDRTRVDDPDQLLDVLRSPFGLDFPPGTRFGEPGVAWAR